MREEVHRSPGPPTLAFTLIELLVVVGLIAVLAGLSVPTLVRAKGSVRAAQCQANLHQLSLALQFYLDDSASYPVFSAWTGNPASSWTEALAPFLSERVLKSRGNTLPASFAECPAASPSIELRRCGRLKYGYVDEGFAFQGVGARVCLESDSWSVRAVREAEVLNPGDTICLGDGISRLRGGTLLAGGTALQRCSPTFPADFSDDFDLTSKELGAIDRRIRRLHSNRANVSYCDGHVEANPLRLLFEDTDSTALSRWNRDHQPHAEWLLP